MCVNEGMRVRVSTELRGGMGMGTREAKGGEGSGTNCKDARPGVGSGLKKTSYDDVNDGR
jgi:hypothetical protein